MTPAEFQALRKRMKLTQEQLANKLDVHISTVRKAEQSHKEVAEVFSRSILHLETQLKHYQLLINLDGTSEIISYQTARTMVYRLGEQFAEPKLQLWYQTKAHLPPTAEDNIALLGPLPRTDRKTGETIVPPIEYTPAELLARLKPTFTEEQGADIVASLWEDSKKKDQEGS